MRTTIEISDGPYRRAKLKVAQRHMTLKRLVAEALESAFIEDSPARKRMTKPPIRLGEGVRLPGLSNREIGELVGEDGMAKAGGGDHDFPG